MKGKWKWFICMMVIFGFVVWPLLMTPYSSAQAPTAPAETPAEGPKLVGDTLGLPGKIGESVAKTPAGTGGGQIDVNAPKGFAGIPGAPQVNWLLALLWAVWVGWIFSTVGAFGGIMAGVGHMTIYGLGPYAGTFRQTNPTLNKTLTDSIRTSNQFLVMLSALLSMINYLKAKRLAWPLGIALALGSIVGAIAIPWLTGGKISFRQYQGWFGVFVLVVGFVLIWETSSKGQESKKAAKAAAKAFEQSVKEKKDLTSQGIAVSKFGLTHMKFTFFGVEFSFNPIWAFVGGVVVAAISAFIGVGGGFLYVPYLTSLVGAPMYVVAGTSAMAVFVSMVASITTYITVAKAGMDWGLIGIQLIGIFIGSMVGPRTQKYIPDIWLKRLFAVLALYVGLRYVTRAFGITWIP
jgi:uncharacterized protein